MEAAAIRDVLRTENNENINRRRKIIALSSLGLVDFSVISLYQTGVIQRLPDLPFALFDSNKVNASKEAYQFGVPDGPVSATLYSLIMVLASAGGNEKVQRKPVFDVLLGGAVAGNLGGALYYLYDMAFKQKKVCLYCLTGAAINIASAVIIAPTVFRSIGKVISRASGKTKG